mgnify:CR=1 FL=1
MKKFLIGIFLTFFSFSFAASTPEKAFDEFMINLKNKDFYNEMILPGELDEISKEETEIFINFFIKQSSKITYQIMSNKKINSKKVILKVKVKYPDVKDYEAELMGEMVKKMYPNFDTISEEEATSIVLQEISKILDKSDLKYEEKILDFQMIKNGNEWTSNDDDKKTEENMYILVLGGIIELFDNL